MFKKYESKAKKFNNFFGRVPGSKKGRKYRHIPGAFTIKSSPVGGYSEIKVDFIIYVFAFILLIISVLSI
ncbi:hypothetical protein DXN04_30920 [Chitinophaga silvisoli]|uniref:DUF5808 domain-containing protein n=1 Tax=Chitinophaga silvisoli TaxID=2291814 RepID=A0A3E1NST5_9BACT|nr:hypothetical protein DXN04_30920 [Chitinophaga silvisoli]